MKKILSIHGGGIRGIIPARILAEIEDMTQEPISSLFDLIAGVSTGGILGLGLTIPQKLERKPLYSAWDMVRLYKKEATTIFNRGLWQKFISIGSIENAKYTRDGIEKVLNKYFGDTTISQALTKFFTYSYDTEKRTPVYFLNWADNKDILMRDVARATSAAQTFFPAHKINIDNDYLSLIDAGIGMNNPSFVSYFKAKALWPDDDILLISLGTGELTKPLLYKKIKDWGLREWAPHLINVSMDCTADIVHDSLIEILPYDQYFHFQIKLYKGSDDMDNVSINNLRILRNLAEEIIRNEKNRLKQLCKLLMENENEKT